MPTASPAAMATETVNASEVRSTEMELSSGIRRPVCVATKRVAA